jgi:proteasome activator subunit 4
MVISALYVDRIPTGFIAWAPTLKAYAPVLDETRLTWKAETQPALEAISSVITEPDYYARLLQLWSQESSRTSSTTELRSDNSTFIKSLAKLFGKAPWTAALAIVEPMMSDPDKYKQRAAAELLAGLLRGAKHWPPSEANAVWDWALAGLQRTFGALKPDTLPCWEGFFSVVLDGFDPRRSQRLVDWILSLPLDFHGNSAFDSTPSRRLRCPLAL